jgi:hypothetical protein
VSDRLYFSCQIRHFQAASVLKEFGKMLGLFPFSKLAKRGPVLRIYALERIEPPVFEREFPLDVETTGADANSMLQAAAEFLQPDCAAEIDTYWDLWQYQRYGGASEWKLLPAPVTLTCFGPDFLQDREDHLRIEFGPDARFLPVPGMEGSLRMGQSNLRSLLRLVSDLEKNLDLETRQVWSESGANFAEVLKHAVGGYHVN